MDHLPEKWTKPGSGDRAGETRPALCPEHGEYLASNIVRNVWSKCPTCASEEAEVSSREAAAEAQREDEARHFAALGSARVPARFIGNSFSNYVIGSNEQRGAHAVVRDFAERFNDYGRKGLGLVLAGAPGTGKTHLAAAVLQTLLDRRVSYMTALDLVGAVRDTWRPTSEQTGTRLMNYLARLDLLVIDEVGVQYGSDSEKIILFNVLDRRYRERRSTMLVTNQDPEGFEAYLGDRSFDRIKQTNTWVPFDWPSYRPIARKAEV